MKADPIWQVSTRATCTAEEAVSTLFETVFGQSPSSYHDARAGYVTVSHYLTTAADWTPARKAALRLGMRLLKIGGIDVGSARVTLRRLACQDWAESWKRHFKALEVGSALLIKPSWSNRHAKKGQATVILDPGLSFGTGNHPTTLFCLGQIASRRQAGRSQSLLDIGTGSGILAVSAAKLGYSPVEAFDCDPTAVRVARHNARLNGVARRIRLKCGDLTCLPPSGASRYDIVCANLEIELVMAGQHPMLSRLRPGGTLVVAGILTREFPRVRSAYTKAGFTLTASRTQGAWTSGTFAAAGRGQRKARMKAGKFS